jgi:hypothetical protein
LHFSETDYISESRDKDVSRQKKRAGPELHLRLLRKEAVPTQFPNLPSYLSTQAATPRASAPTREEISQKRCQLKKLQLYLLIVQTLKSVREESKNQLHPVSTPPSLGPPPALDPPPALGPTPVPKGQQGCGLHSSSADCPKIIFKLPI